MNLSKRYVLGDDPMCGLTTGGMDDCFWECEVTPTGDGPLITNPECLLNCFPKVSKNAVLLCLPLISPLPLKSTQVNLIHLRDE